MAVVLVSIAIALLIGLAIVQLRRVLTWLLVAGFLTTILISIVDWLSRRMARWIAVGLLCLAFMALLIGGFAMVLPPLIAQAKELIRIAPDLVQTIYSSKLMHTLNEHFGVGKTLEGQIAAALRRAPLIAGELFQFARMTATAFAGLLSVFFATLFMLYSGPAFIERAFQFSPVRVFSLWERTAPRIARSLRRYAAGMVLISVAAGVVAMLCLIMAGVPYFLPVAAAVSILGFVPFIGATVSALILGGLTWASVGFTRALIVVLAFLVYNQIENNVWQPLVHHQTVRLSPLTVLVAMLIGAELVGLWGLIFAVPCAGIIQIVVREILAERREQQFLHNNHPPLTPLSSRSQLPSRYSNCR